MKSKYKKYILKNINKKSAGQIAKELNINEEEIKKLLSDKKENKPKESYPQKSLSYLFQIIIVLIVAFLPSLLKGPLIGYYDNANILTYLAATAMHAGNSDKAFTLFNKIVTGDLIHELSPQESAIVYNQLGCLYDKNGDSKNALDSFRKAVDLNPNFKQAQQNLKTVSERYNAKNK